MTVTFSAGNNAVSVAPSDLIQSAGLEAAIFGAGDRLTPQDLAWGLEKLQRLIDSYAAIRDLIFNVSFSLFNLQANHSPHTIGPGGDFNVPIRPTKIVSANFVLNGSSANPVDSPRLRIRDNQWWAAQPLKSLVSSICTDLFYDPAVPLGNCNFWPICNTVAPARLELWSSLPQAIDLQTQMAFPQGYWDLIVKNLAVELCSSYDKDPKPVLVQSAQRALSTVIGNNSEPPRIRTDASMPGTSGLHYNFLTGLNE
jgi:hypothetical protein